MSSRAGGLRFARTSSLILLLACLGAGNGGRAAAAEYRLVDTLSKATEVTARAADDGALLGTLSLVTPEADVRNLAAAEMAGRARGTAGNARGRAYIVARLKQTGLTPLFEGSFEQRTFPGGRSDPYATNLGAYLPAARADAEWIVLVAHYDHLGMKGGEVYAGADDNASSVAMLLALSDVLGRARPQYQRHVVFLFPDAEEPPHVRTERMGSTWFWMHSPFPTEKLHCALVFDLMGSRASPGMQAAGLGDALFVLGAEASPGLARLARGVPAEPGVEPILMGLPMIEAYPYVSWRRFARSDYHGLRENGRRPFLLLTTGRTPTYHTPQDTPDTLDYAKMAHVLRWVARLLARATDGSDELGWTDFVADPKADARILLRLYPALGDETQYPWPLRRAIASDRATVEELLRRWDAGAAPGAAEYRLLQLAALRLQAALWRPRGWYFSLW